MLTLITVLEIINVILILTIIILYFKLKFKRNQFERLKCSLSEIESWDIKTWDNKIRFKFNLNGYLAFGCTTIKQTKGILTTDNKIYYPNRYFAYSLVNGKPTILVEQMKINTNGTKQPYFTKLNLKIIKTDKAHSANLLICSINTSKTFEISKAIELGECFHINKLHQIIVEPMPKNEPVI